MSSLARIAAVLKGAFGFVGAETNELTGGIESSAGGIVMGRQGALNTAIGVGAAPLLVMTNTDRESADGVQNTAVGDGVLQLIVHSAENTAVGSWALHSLTDVGGYNTAIGAEAMKDHTGSYNSVAIGLDALMIGPVANCCVAVGFDALVQTGADGNTGVGYSALFNNVSGINNVALGWNAGYPGEEPTNANSGNADCVFIGAEAGASVGTLLTNAIAIGRSAAVGASNKAQIGNSSITQVKFGGTNTTIVTGTKTPASATATGTAGEVAWDASYIYVCVATNTWKRSALTTW